MIGMWLYHGDMTGRIVRVGAAQLGPIAKDDSREVVVDRLIAMVQQAADRGVQLVVFPELALTTFFPRWYTDDISGHDHYYETEMPGPETKRLFDEAKTLGIGFSLGYAELTPEGERFNTTILVERDGSVVGRYRKVHIPGHENDEPWRHSNTSSAATSRSRMRDSPCGGPLTESSAWPRATIGAGRRPIARWVSKVSRSS